MELTMLFVSGRSATLQFEDGGRYHTMKPYRVLLNGEPWGEMTTVVHSLFSLWPDTEYSLKIMDGDVCLAQTSFRTEEESFTLNVRRFGAVGDGVHDDTAAIQCAINCCPEKGRVLIPAGDYHVLPLFLKSHIRLEIARGARLMLETDRSRFPIQPGMIQSTDETDDLNLGSWEGNPIDMFAAMISGFRVEDVVIYGEGTLDGCADKGDWWVNHRVKRGAWRPRMLFINDCENVTMQGLHVCSSPSWNLQPYYSRNLRFLNLHITAPADSPNTDGFDPESCQGVLLSGVHFSLGDDCIAIKASKIYMGTRYAVICRDILISHCLMENGHGGVTCGSEMAGGVVNVRVKDCVMRNTDRGLRIKTRRGRGKNGVVDDIAFDNVEMDHVGTPFVVNALYFCDPDGHSPYVQCREKLPVDDRTPRVGTIAFRKVHATGVSCAGYFLGLPEKPIEHVIMEDVSLVCDPDAPLMQPAMADGVPDMNRTGVVATNVERITLKNVSVTGQEGEWLLCDGVGTVEAE